MTYSDSKPNWMNLARNCLSIGFAAVFITACSDGTDTLGTGGGAGDEDDANSEAIALITPLVGFYDLPTNWAGVPESNAFFEVRTPDNTGLSEAVIFRVDPDQNCLESFTTSGEITKDLFSDRLFLDGIFELENGIVSLSNGNLVISLPADVQDVDNDGDDEEPAVLQASGFFGDLPDTCQA